MIADVPLARLPRGMTHATARIPDGGGVRLHLRSSSPFQDSFWEAARKEVEKAPTKSRQSSTRRRWRAQSKEDVEANQGGGVRLKPPPLKAVSSIEDGPCHCGRRGMH